MTLPHEFGGKWTEKKLTYLQKYLQAYTTIFTSNSKARYFHTIYVDAFAGTGKRNIPHTPTGPMFLDEEDVKSFQAGSAMIALETEPPFGTYFFIEQNIDFATQLEELREQFSERAIIVKQGDANDILVDWCHSTHWEKHRAVVFLDPYGMAVNWNTIETIAATKAIDLWLLFPLGQGVNRLLTKEPPKDGFAKRLTSVFGTDAWKEAFYAPTPQLHMFNMENKLKKTATFESIKDFFVNRLDTVFEKVAKNPLLLYNSKNVPIYLLCFAAANPTGAKTAVNIAQHILGK